MVQLDSELTEPPVPAFNVRAVSFLFALIAHLPLIFKVVEALLASVKEQFEAPDTTFQPANVCVSSVIALNDILELFDCNIKTYSSGLVPFVK